MGRHRASITADKLYYAYHHDGTVASKEKSYPGFNYASNEGDKLEPEALCGWSDSTGARYQSMVMATGTSGNNTNRLFIRKDQKAARHNGTGTPFTTTRLFAITYKQP